MPQQFPEGEGAYRTFGEELAPEGPDARARSLSGHLRTWIALARLTAKWVETVIPQRVNCVVGPRTLEPLLCGKIQRVGRMQQGKQAELQIAEFDAVPCTKVSEIHVLRVETTSSSLSVGALYRPSLGFFCRLECSGRAGVYCTRASLSPATGNLEN